MDELLQLLDAIIDRDFAPDAVDESSNLGRKAAGIAAGTAKKGGRGGGNAAAPLAPCARVLSVDEVCAALLGGGVSDAGVSAFRASGVDGAAVDRLADGCSDRSERNWPEMYIKGRCPPCVADELSATDRKRAWAVVAQLAAANQGARDGALAGARAAARLREWDFAEPATKCVAAGEWELDASVAVSVRLDPMLKREDELQLRVPADSTVADLKAAVEERSGICAKKQSLTCRGKLLDDACRVADSGALAGAELILIPCPSLWGRGLTLHPGPPSPAEPADKPLDLEVRLQAPALATAFF